jgi:hypothetical protein
MTVKQWIVLAAVAVPVLAFVVVMAVRQNRHRAWEQTAFGAAMDDYLAPAAASRSSTSSPS